jgi:hypothetical protein
VYCVAGQVVERGQVLIEVETSEPKVQST